MSDIVKKDNSEGLLRSKGLPDGKPSLEFHGRDFMGNEGAIRYDYRNNGHEIEGGTRDSMGNKSYFKIRL